MKLRADQIPEAIEVLKATPLFQGCAPEALAQLATQLEWRAVKPNAVVLMDQEINRTLYLLSKGSVGVYKRVEGERRQLATLKAPNFFGERSMFEESPASALVKTEEASILFTLEHQKFVEVAAGVAGMSDVVRQNMIAVREQRATPASENPPASPA
jgi:CRP-like cAMP-binding protein